MSLWNISGHSYPVMFLYFPVLVGIQTGWESTVHSILLKFPGGQDLPIFQESWGVSFGGSKGNESVWLAQWEESLFLLLYPIPLPPPHQEGTRACRSSLLEMVIFWNSAIITGFLCIFIESTGEVSPWKSPLCNWMAILVRIWSRSC